MMTLEKQNDELEGEEERLSENASSLSDRSEHFVNTTMKVINKNVV